MKIEDIAPIIAQWIGNNSYSSEEAAKKIVTDIDHDLLIDLSGFDSFGIVLWVKDYRKNVISLSDAVTNIHDRIEKYCGSCNNLNYFFNNLQPLQPLQPITQNQNNLYIQTPQWVNPLIDLTSQLVGSIVSSLCVISATNSVGIQNWHPCDGQEIKLLRGSELVELNKKYPFLPERLDSATGEVYLRLPLLNDYMIRVE